MNRLDIEIVNRGLVSSRSKAKNYIELKSVFVNGILAEKASQLVEETDEITVRNEDMPFVSRGGLKLQKALSIFQVDVTEKICIDVGASTGGFTDCLLQNGAKKVYAVDVGRDQLHDTIKNDFRVVNLEETNFRYLEADDFNDSIDFICGDVSFISLNLIFPNVSKILSKNGKAVFLIKPQFEAGKEHMEKNGIIKNKKTHERILNNVVQYALEQQLYAEQLIPSPITGGDGNHEYLILLSKETGIIKSFPYSAIVKKAFEA